MFIFSQRYQAEINDLENLGEIGSGTCGQVWKMRFKKTGHIIAVKVRYLHDEGQPSLTKGKYCAEGSFKDSLIIS